MSNTASSLPEESAQKGKFLEGNIYFFTVIGFFTCENLTNTWLPALGLRTLAHQYENAADFIAPYLLLPVCLVLILALFKRNIFAGLIATAGSLLLDWYFFIRYSLVLSRLSLVVIGVGVLLGYIVYRAVQKRVTASSVVTKAQRWRTRAIYTGVYVVSFFIAVYLAPMLRQLGGRDIGFATATLPSLVVLVVYLLMHLPTRQRVLPQHV